MLAELDVLRRESVCSSLESLRRQALLEEALAEELRPALTQADKALQEAQRQRECMLNQIETTTKTALEHSKAEETAASGGAGYTLHEASPPPPPPPPPHARTPPRSLPPSRPKLSTPRPVAEPKEAESTCPTPHATPHRTPHTPRWSPGRRSHSRSRAARSLSRGLSRGLSLGGLSHGGLSHGDSSEVDEEVAGENLRLRLEVLQLNERVSSLTSQVEGIATTRAARPRRRSSLDRLLRRGWLLRALALLRARLAERRHVA